MTDLQVGEDTRFINAMVTATTRFSHRIFEVVTVGRGAISLPLRWATEMGW